MAAVVDVQVKVTKSFHDDAPFWELASTPGVEAASCEDVPGCGHYLSLRGTYEGAMAVAAAVAGRWPDVAAAIEEEVGGGKLDLSVGIEYGIFRPSDTGYDVET